MPAVIDLVVNDGLGVPVARTFIPIEQVEGVWNYENQLGINPLGFRRITLSLTRPKGGAQGTSSSSRNARFKAQIHLPVLETLGNNSSGLTPAPTIAYKPALMIESILPERSTVADRTDLLAFAVNLLGTTTVRAMVLNLQPVF